jgi:hypothetical protein
MRIPASLIIADHFAVSFLKGEKGQAEVSPLDQEFQDADHGVHRAGHLRHLGIAPGQSGKSVE